MVQSQADRSDVIHLKSMHLSIPYYTTLVERLARVLSAGGLLVMAESEPSYVSSKSRTSGRADGQLSTSGQPMHRSLRQWDAAVREAYAVHQIWQRLTFSRRRSTFQSPLMPIDQCCLVSCSSPAMAKLIDSATPVYTQELGIPCGSYVRGCKSHFLTHLSRTLMRCQPSPSPLLLPRRQILQDHTSRPNPIHLPSYRSEAYTRKCLLLI
jgi:hypothetical protein